MRSAAAHVIQRLYQAEDLVRRWRADEHRRHAAAQRAALGASERIVLITYRPQEVLAPDELCGPGQTRRASADGRVHAVDLASVIRRFDVMRTTTTARRSREFEEA